MNAARQEIQLLSKLNHENVISLIDFYEDDYCLYLVMDLMADDVRNVMANCNQSFDEDFAKIIFK